jgi:hypothetical protein
MLSTQSAQRKSVDEFVQLARSEGCEVFQACATIPDRGIFYPPTLITNVNVSE